MRFERKKRGYSRYFVIFSLIIALILSLVLFGRSLLTNSSFFNVDKIEFNKVNYLSKSFLDKIVDKYYGNNIFSFDKKDIILDFENVIRIDKISVKKSLPNKLKIYIKEKVDKYYIKTKDGKLLPISSDLMILNDNKYYPYNDTQIISVDFTANDLKIGEKIDNMKLIKIVNYFERIKKIAPKFASEISEIYLDKEGDICLIEEKKGNIAVLGNENLKIKIERFKYLNSLETYSRNKIVLKFAGQAIIK